MLFTPVHSLARRLTAWFFVVALVPLIATSALSYWSSRTMVASLLEENLGKTARLYASEVDDFLAEKTALLGALAGGLEPDPAVLTEVVERTPTIEELLILDEDGTIVARSRDRAGWVEQVCRSPSLETPMQHTHEGGHEVVVAVPRRDGGRLCGRVSFTLHQDMISDRARSTFGGLAYIVDRSGTVVCHAFEEHEPHVHPGQPIQGPAAEHAARGEPWHGTVEIDGRPHLAAWAPASTLPWGVWAEVPLDETEAVLRPMTTRAVGFGAVLALLLSGGILFLARRIAAPIEELAAASQRIAAGAYGETVIPRSDDEIGLLAREFNAMSLALAEAVRTLDAKVAERTAALQEAQRFSDTLLDTLEQRIFVIDPNGTVLKANRAALDAYGPQLVGGSCDRLHGDGPCPTSRFFEEGVLSSEERVRKRPDGHNEILQVDRYPIPGPDGPVALLEIERDITRSKQIQARLIHQEKMAALGTLAAGLAHEIGNPLASLSSELELLAMDPEGMEDALPVMQDQVRRMKALLRELVDRGRPPQEDVRRFEVRVLLDDVLRLLRHTARERKVRLETHFPEGLTAVGSRDRLLQILLNLGLNAIDASPPDATVEMGCTPIEDGVRFWIADRGPGLPDDPSVLFEPFYTTKPVGQGTGLGLFVVHRLVTALRGRIEATNRAGGGARFTVEIPQPQTGAGDA